MGIAVREGVSIEEIISRGGEDLALRVAYITTAAEKKEDGNG